MLFDSSAWIELFKGTSEGLKVKEILKSEDVITSIVSLAEIRAWFAKNNKSFDEFLGNIKETSTIVSLKETMALQAGIFYHIRRKEVSSFGMIDSIIYATAQYYNHLVLTTDNHFKGLEGVELL